MRNEKIIKTIKDVGIEMRPTMNTTETANHLLMSCPDDQITRMQIVWQRAAAGEWLEAALHLRNAAAEGESSWHDRCAELADVYEKRK